METSRNANIQGVLFDWDGTLLDSYHADSSAYLAMFREMGIPWGIEELTQHYSPNWYAVYRAAGLPKHRWDDADAAWRKQYTKHKPSLIKGVPRILTKLRGRHRLGLVTSGDRDRVTRQLREFKLTRLFSARVCSGDTPRKKPHPEPLRLALQKMRLAPGDCVYVGDSPEDIEMARHAGVRAIGVLGPFPTENRLRAAKPELLLNSIQELTEALDSMLG
jgi:HAD superfamily hydrolase (TIGR01549 family)